MTLFYFYFIKIASELRQNCVDGINETLDIFERISFRLKNRLILSRWHNRKWEHGKHFKSHSKTQTKTMALNDCQIIIVLRWKPINVITEYYHLVNVIKFNLIYLTCPNHSFIGTCIGCPFAHYHQLIKLLSISHCSKMITVRSFHWISNY